MANAKYKPNKRNAPTIWQATGRLLGDLARQVERGNNAAFAPNDPRNVHAETSEGESRHTRHRSAVIAASGPAIRDQARTNRLLSVLSRTRV